VHPHAGPADTRVIFIKFSPGHFDAIVDPAQAPNGDAPAQSSRTKGSARAPPTEEEKAAEQLRKYKQWVLSRLEDPGLQGAALFKLPRGYAGEDGRLRYDQEGLRKRYLKLSKLIHPDKNGDDPRCLKAFQRLEGEYDKLKTSGRDFTQEGYDETAEDADGPQGAAGATGSATGATGATGSGRRRRRAEAEAPASSPAASPADIAMDIEACDADPAAEPHDYDLSITCSWKKSPAKTARPLD
jgi:hypothetical protein